jgi:hypothetical protein
MARHTSRYSVRDPRCRIVCAHGVARRHATSHELPGESTGSSKCVKLHLMGVRRWRLLLSLGSALAAAVGVTWLTLHLRADDSPGCTERLLMNDRITCAEQADAYWCWGSNIQGELGNPSFSHSNQPTKVAFPRKGVPSISTRDETGCMVEHGELQCWGKDLGGWLSEGPEFSLRKPTLIPRFPNDLVAVHAADLFVCAERASGTLVCKTWLPDRPSLFYEVELPGRPSSVHVSKSVACAIHSGNVYCWGRSAWGGTCSQPGC